MVERVYSPMLNRQQCDELVASLQSLEELWETAAGVSVIQNNIIIENLLLKGIKGYWQIIS